MALRMHPVNKLLDYFGLRLVRSQREAAHSDDSKLFKATKGDDETEVRWTGRGLLHMGNVHGVFNPNYSRDKNFVWSSYISRQMAARQKPGAKVLDIASSLEWVMGLAAAGIDISYVELRKHPVQDFFPFSYNVADASDLPFADALFDTVTFWQLLHHVGCLHGQAIDHRKDEVVLREIHRVLKPGGIALCSTLVKDGGRSLLPFGYSRIYSLDVIRKKFKRCGFDILDEELRHATSYQNLRETELRGDFPQDYDFTNDYGDLASFTLTK